MDALINLFNSIFAYAYPGSMIQGVQNTIEKTATLLTNSSAFLEAIYDAMVMIGIGLAITYFVIDLINTSMTTELSIDKFMKSLITLLFTILLVQYGYNILLPILNLGSTLAQYITFDNSSAIAQTFDNGIFGSIWDALIGVISLLPGFLVHVAVSIVATLVLYSRLVESAVMLVLSPIGLSDAFARGPRSNAVSFIKRVLALALQALIIVLVLAIVNDMYTQGFFSLGLQNLVGGFVSDDVISALTEGVGTMATVIVTSSGSLAISAVVGMGIISFITQGAMCFVIVSFMMKSRQLATDIVGR